MSQLNYFAEDVRDLPIEFKKKVESNFKRIIIPKGLAIVHRIDYGMDVAVEIEETGDQFESTVFKTGKSSLAVTVQFSETDMDEMDEEFWEKEYTFRIQRI